MTDSKQKAVKAPPRKGNRPRRLGTCRAFARAVADLKYGDGMAVADPWSNDDGKSRGNASLLAMGVGEALGKRYQSYTGTDGKRYWILADEEV